MERKTYRPGDRVFIEGEPADYAYLIEEGAIELSKRKDNDVVVIGSVGKGEMVGEMALIDSSLRSATARCSKKTKVLVVPKDDFEQRLDKADPVIRRLLQLLIRRLREQNQAITDKSTIVR